MIKKNTPAVEKKTTNEKFGEFQFKSMIQNLTGRPDILS